MGDALRRNPCGGEMLAAVVRRRRRRRETAFEVVYLIGDAAFDGPLDQKLVPDYHRPMRTRCNTRLDES